MSVRDPTLLVDVGGTLLHRPCGGSVARASTVLTELGLDAAPDEVARPLQTGKQRMEAVAALAARWPERRDLPAKLDAALTDGGYEILPGAIELLRTARHAGFRVLACTNMTAWQEPLPCELSEHLDGVLSSVGRAALKSDEAFWQSLVGDGIVDPATTLVVGDSPSADAEAPGRVGICSLLLHDNVDLPRISGWLERLRPPPPDAVALVGGVPMRWAGRTIWEARHLSGLLERVTRRRAWVELAPGRRVRATLVRRQRHPPALVLDESVAAEGVAWLAAKSLARPINAPADVKLAIARAGLSLDSLAPAAQRHLFAMVREARDPGVRARRINDVLEFLRECPR